jgi:hypothetical protein
MKLKATIKANPIESNRSQTKLKIEQLNQAQIQQLNQA